MYVLPVTRNYLVPPRPTLGGLRSRGSRRGLGALPANTNGKIASPAFRRPPIYGWGVCPAWGCGPAPVGGPFTINTSGTTSAQTAGTPVPPGYSQNSVFIASDGSQWEFSSAQGKWINVGTPYNLNPGSTAPQTTSTASTAAQVSGTPVPVGYPITSAFTDSFGNTWSYNGAYGVWTQTSAASSSLVPSSSGSTTVVSSTAPNTLQSFFDWLSGPPLIAPIPNLALALGLGIAAWKFMQPAGRR
jgi:hypothetical protein